MKYARLVILGEDGENPPQDMPPYFLLTKERTTIGRSRTADMTMDSEAYPWCVGGGCWGFFVVGFVSSSFLVLFVWHLLLSVSQRERGRRTRGAGSLAGRAAGVA